MDMGYRCVTLQKVKNKLLDYRVDFRGVIGPHEERVFILSGLLRAGNRIITVPRGTRNRKISRRLATTESVANRNRLAAVLLLQNIET